MDYGSLHLQPSVGEEVCLPWGKSNYVEEAGSRGEQMRLGLGMETGTELVSSVQMQKMVELLGCAIPTRWDRGFVALLCRC